MHHLKPSQWQELPSKVWPGMDKASWPPCDTNFDNAGPALAGFNRPTRYEGKVNNLEVYGTIPPSISGTFYRIMPEPYHVPFVKNDIWLNGDGAISSFRIKNGNVDFKQRFVKTEKFRVETNENRALIGKYRNPYTDLVKFADRTTANTTAFPFKGVILALKEDSQPYAVDPRTLETIGKWDFDGQLESETFTAHPKYDVKTREVLSFGYEGKGVGTRDVFYMSIDEHGNFNEKVWFQAPFCGFQHEMAFTDNWVIFPLVPMECFMDKLKQGGNHWTWTDRPHYVGLLPRREAKSSDIKWFQGPNLFTGHVANAWEENGQVHLHVSMVRGNGFGFFPDQNGEAPDFDLEVLAPHVCEFVLDPHSTKLVYQAPTEVVTSGPNEFPRIDDRVFGKKNRFIYGNMIDMSPGVTDWEYSAPLAGDGIGHMNVLYKYDLVTGVTQKYIRGPRHFFQEPQFVPRHPGAAEGDGFLIALVNNFDEMTSELVIIDCDDFEKHAAIAKLPVRLRPGFHGNWVDDTDIDGRPITIAEVAIPHRRDGNNETNEKNGQ
ncbi:Lignostilbene-alpha,beta-dioxygenase isozyme I [Colletotrichum siamense]|uniref:Lignostilbene-alpha,beta-dioxygenase isozyme I n=1 Tax=Colletotrichum siamense TaxID=690259 RepID=UPI0018729BCC|nr:Lignostilbene-alpha,beta-dioxygenase isozyme I [Colletotrichum siamense]KAF5495076.1 Lignostilbene-alpha,beta-dioxygenase isozyme I [Colletotrichum siamense]